MNALRSERGSVVVGGLTKLLLLLLVVGVVAYDGIAIGYTKFSASNHGKSAADTAGDVWRETGDIQKAYEAAQGKLNPTGEHIVPGTFQIVKDDDTVSFTVTTTASTLIAQQLGFTRSMTDISVDIKTDSAAPSS